MDIFKIAQRVKRGVALLDKKVPGWRRVMREHKDQFDLESPAHCVLGTLEHYSAQLKRLNQKRVEGMTDADYKRGLKRLAIVGEYYGFNSISDGSYDIEDDDEMTALEGLWRAEFMPTEAE